MRSVLRWIVLLPVGLVLLVFAFANRRLVDVVFDPFGNDVQGLSFTLPLFAVIIGSLALGVIVGGIAVWFGQGRYRRAARQALADAERLRQQAAADAPSRGTSLARL